MKDIRVHPRHSQIEVRSTGSAPAFMVKSMIKQERIDENRRQSAVFVFFNEDARNERSIMRLTFALTLFTILSVTTATTLGQGPRQGPVWFWFATCGGPLITLEIRFDDRVVHKSTFPVCHSGRESVDSQGQVGKIQFGWRPDRVVVWQGYRDEANGLVVRTIPRMTERQQRA